MKTGFTTEALAEGTGHKPQTLRAAYSKNGHWCNVVPAKLPNGRLLWPADSISRLASGARALLVATVGASWPRLSPASAG